MFMRAPLQNRDIANEKNVARNVREALLAEDYDRVCFVAGRFAEETAVKLYMELNASRPRNAKTVIDYITDNAVPRPLGAKMHVIRELRNGVAHKFKLEITESEEVVSVPTYQVT